MFACQSGQSTDTGMKIFGFHNSLNAASCCQHSHNKACLAVRQDSFAMLCYHGQCNIGLDIEPEDYCYPSSMLDSEAGKDLGLFGPISLWLQHMCYGSF